MMSASDESVVMTRIADALERIAAALESRKPKAIETPFPWHKMSARLRKGKMRWEHYHEKVDTCESLIRLGRSFIAREKGSGWKGCPPLHAKEIGEEMERLGFGDKWKSS
jgi:hypothetical protein